MSETGDDLLLDMLFQLRNREWYDAYISSRDLFDTACNRTKTLNVDQVVKTYLVTIKNEVKE